MLILHSFPNKAVFEEVCEETLESLTDVFEELVENADHLKGADVSFSVSLFRKKYYFIIIIF